MIHEEESSLRPLELNLELQLQHDANQGASHVSSMSNAHHSDCCCHMKECHHIFIASPSEEQ